MFHTLVKSPRRYVVLGLVILAAAFISLTAAPQASAAECMPAASGLPTAECCKCTPTPEPDVQTAPAATNNDICVTSKTRVAVLKDRKVFAIFSDFVESNPNGMLITEIPFSAVRSVTDAEKASGEIIWLVSKDSEYARGWHVALYWYDGYYGAQITGSDFFDDTGAKCGF